jgi:hypothetical protein
MDHAYLDKHFPLRSSLAIREFCDTFGIGRTLFHRLQKEGQIQTIKFGSRTLIPMGVVKAWLDAAITGQAADEGEGDGG